MKKFKGVRQQEEIVSKMKELGYEWTNNSKVAYSQGSDYNGFQNKEGVFILISVFNGSFRIRNLIEDTLIATNESYELDNEKWYSDILEAINIPLEKKE